MNTGNENGDWNENRKVVFNELERLSDCVADLTPRVGSLETRVAVLWLKVSMLAAAAGVGGGVGTVLAKALFD